MDHAKSLPVPSSSSSFPTPRRKWLVLVLRLAIMELVMFATLTTSEDDQALVPAAGLLCISDCATCPVICSPPPPPPESKPSPAESKPPPASPPVHHSPPQSYYYKSPPPLSLPPPPPSYISWGSNPPPPSGYMNFPSGQAPPNPNMGRQGNYTYPYYYFYASKAASLSLHSSFILMVSLSFLITMLDYQCA